MPQVFQQALWIGGTDQEDKAQEVDLLKSMTGAELERSSAPKYFQKGSSNLNLGQPSGVSLEILALSVSLLNHRESPALPEDREATPTGRAGGRPLASREQGVLLFRALQA
jgi:hypothetical protein